MWYELDINERKEYERYITNFASLSEVFSQKDDNSEVISPIVNSKFQESVFQYSFGATGEDIGNTSFDVSLVMDDEHKYLVGIKTFGIGSGDQKIAQFKESSATERWNEKITNIEDNYDSMSEVQAKEFNNEIYLELAHRISELRNARIASSISQIRGFDTNEVELESVYHVLMPSKKGEKPQIFVGETSYLPIDIDNLEILGATSPKHLGNFKFKDGNHTYKYTSSDSQLHMSFENKKIALETWDVHYIEDPYELFQNLHLRIKEDKHDEPTVLQSFSWMIPNKNGEVERYSGYNAFNGASKLAVEQRRTFIEDINTKYSKEISMEEMKIIIRKFEEILLVTRSTTNEKIERDYIKNELSEILAEIGNVSLINDIEKQIYRPVSEMYIPIPNARKFHEENPDFFGENMGTLKDGSSSLALDIEDRTFKMKFLSSKEIIDAYITQDNGKAIQSVHKQDILGDWILREVFQLEEREILTKKRLDEIGINAVRLSKIKESDDSEVIGFEFIWIDINEPPEDAIGWVDRID